MTRLAQGGYAAGHQPNARLVIFDLTRNPDDHRIFSEFRLTPLDGWWSGRSEGNPLAGGSETAHVRCRWLYTHIQNIEGLSSLFLADENKGMERLNTEVMGASRRQGMALAIDPE